MKPQNTMPPGMSPRGKKQEKPQPPPANKGFRFGSPLGYIALLLLGFMLFKNVFQEVCLNNQDIQPVLDRQAKELNTIVQELNVPCWAPDPVSAKCEVA